MMMVEAAEVLNLDDPTLIDGMDWTRIRAVHLERLMAAPSVVIAKVAGQDPPQVPFVENDDVIQTLSSDTADHPKLTNDAGCSPERIRCRHAPDEIADFSRDSGAAGFPCPTQLPPILPELPSAPGEDGLGPDDHQCPSSARPHPGQPGPENPVAGADAEPTAGSAKHGQLMPERKVVDLERCSGSEGPAEGAEQSGKPSHGTGILRLIDC